MTRSDYQPALTSGYFLYCLLIDRLSIKINACFTLISGNLGLYFQQSCLGQASVLSHCTSKRLLDFPRLFPRKVIFLCCIYVFNCRHEIHDLLVSHPIWPFWKDPVSFFKEHNKSFIVKPRIISSSGDVPQAIMGCTKGMSSVPLQHFPVSPPKKKQIQNKQMPSTILKMIFLPLHSICVAQPLQLCLQGLFWGIFCLGTVVPPANSATQG